MPTARFSGNYKSLSAISDFVASVARSAGFNKKVVYNLQLAVDEAVTNVIEHAYGGEGVGDIELTIDPTELGLQIVVHDWGSSFDPSQVPEPEFDVPLEELQSRGAGIYLIRRIMDEVHYEFDPQKGNRLTMVKYW